MNPLTRREFLKLASTSSLGLMLAACGVVPTPTTLAPTNTPAPATTIVPTSTVAVTTTPTAIPTIQVQGKAGVVLRVPDPRLSDPTLFDLTRSDSPIPQFVKAMQMAGITVTGQQVNDGVDYVALKEVNGNDLAIGFYNLGPASTNQGEAFKGAIPLIIFAKDSKSKAVNWRGVGLGDFGVDFGVHPFYKDKDNKIVNDIRYDKVVNQNFNMLTVGRGVAWKYLEQQPGQFARLSVQDFSGEKDFLATRYPGIENKRLHALIWPSQFPDWFWGGNYTVDQLTDAIKKRVSFILTRPEFNDVKEIVVVNEPWLHPEESKTMPRNVTLLFERDSDGIWRLKQSFIFAAFEEARAVKPKAMLVYNDVANNAPKIAGDYDPNGLFTNVTFANVLALRQRALVDAVGLQMHIHANKLPTIDDTVRTMQEYSLPVVISELDVRLDKLPPSHSTNQRMLSQVQAYSLVVNAALKSGVVRNLAIWDFGDQYSWYKDYQNIPNADATPYDFVSAQYKPAYYAILKELFSAALVR